MRFDPRLAVPLALTSLLAGLSPEAHAQKVWEKVLGTSAPEGAGCVASDGAGGCFTAFSTSGNLFAPQGSAGNDFALARMSANGTVVWGFQVGTPTAFGVVTDLCADATGGVFVGGYTANDLGGPNLGGFDAFVQHYDAAGALLWEAKVGSLGHEIGAELAPTAAGGVYLAGSTKGDVGTANAGGNDAYLARFAPNGTLEWTRQWGTAEDDSALGLAEDGADGVFVCGNTNGALSGPLQGITDGWLRRVDSAGVSLWELQQGSNKQDWFSSVATDGAGGVFVAGYTWGNWPGQPANSKALIGRFDAAGNELWMRALFGDSMSYAMRIAADASGGAYLTSQAFANVGGPLWGTSDKFFFHIEGDGNVDWTDQWGCSSSDNADDICVSASGGFFALGSIFAKLGSQPYLGDGDQAIYRFTDACFGATSYCAASPTSIPGCQANLYTFGAMNLYAPTAFRIRSTPVPGGNIGLCVFSDLGPAAIPFGTLGGVVCVQPPLYRTVAVPTGGTLGTCDGALDLPLSYLISASPIVVAGADLFVQLWARDPANPDGALLSDGLTFSICP